MISSANLDSTPESGELWVWSAKFWLNFLFPPIFYGKVSNGVDFFHRMIEYLKLTHKDLGPTPYSSQDKVSIFWGVQRKTLGDRTKLLLS